MGNSDDWLGKDIEAQMKEAGKRLYELEGVKEERDLEEHEMPKLHDLREWFEHKDYEIGYEEMQYEEQIARDKAELRMEYEKERRSIIAEYEEGEEDEEGR